MDNFSLPVLAYRPDVKILNNALDKMEITQLNDFEESASLDIVTHKWLTSLVGRELSWISEEESEKIKEKAARRLAQASGVTGRTSVIRTLHLQNFTVDLYEPGVTEENLGHTTWGSALVLSKRLEKNPNLLQGRVIELGAGTGLCGLVAAKLGYTVLLTDLPGIVPNLRINVSRNAGINVDVAALDWSRPETFNMEHTFDTILVSDPVYTPGHSKLLANTIKYIGSPRVIIEIPIREGWHGERLNLNSLMHEMGYHPQIYEEQEAVDEFGKSRSTFTLWINDIKDP